MTILFEEIRNKSNGLLEIAHELANDQDILDPTLTYLANQSYQSPFFVAYVFGS